LLTPDQLAADGALVVAIDTQHRLYDPATQGVVTDYVVVAQRQWIDGQGDFCSEVYLTTPEETSLSAALGLCEFATTQYRKMAID